jgi:signal peptidase I
MLQSGQAKMIRDLGYRARDLILSVIIALVIILFLYQPVKVEGTSMMPALEDQERVFINKFAYRFGISEVERGDTVVFWYLAIHRNPTSSA